MLFPVQGSKFYVSAAFQTAKVVSAISNTSPPVCSATAHGFVDNDEVLILNDQEDVGDSVYRVDQLTTDTFSLPGYDLTDTNFYPAASSVGTAQKIASGDWIEIGQVVSVSGQGGNAKYIETPLVNRRRPVKQPVGFEASSLEFVLGFDKSRADQVALLAASRVFGKRAFKFYLAGPTYFYCYGTVSVSNLPTIDPASVLKRNVAISIDGLFTQF